MFQFTRDHGQNKKGDKVESHEIDHIDYLIRVGVLEEVAEVKEEVNPLYPLHTFSKSKKKRKDE